MTDKEKEIIYVSPFLQAKVPSDTPVLLAFSGGADSSALLHLLAKDSQKCGFPVYAAHFNHKIRGEEAERDMLFCRSAAEKYGIPFFCGEADVPSLAKKHGNSLELEARECRYGFFAEIMKKYNIPVLVTAHHANDRAESLILHLLRGSGLAGLRSIESRRTFGNFVLTRPLINASRRSIINYCEKNGIEYVTDSTNADNTYMRNAVRSNIIPELEKIQPRIISLVGRSCDSLAEDENYLASRAREFLSRNLSAGGIPLEAINRTHPAIFKRAVIIYFSEFSDKMLEYVHINSICGLCRRSVPNSKVSLPDNMTAKTEDGKLIFEKISKNADIPYYKFYFDKGEKSDDKTVIRPYPDITIEISKSENITEKEISDILREKGLNILIECDKMSNGMFFRNRRAKDTIYINGMNKKVKKLMCDAKIPQNIRDRLPILCKDDEILWIPMLPPCDNIRKDKITAGKSYFIINLKITNIK